MPFEAILAPGSDLMSDGCWKSLVVLLVSTFAIGTMGVGCNKPPGINPWRDDAIARDAWTTPSRDGVLADDREPVIRHRDVAASEVPVARESVPHKPLWWEDPFEDKGDGDGRFAVTYADYLAMPYGLGRYIVNALGWPISAVVTPPETAMVSDGRISEGGLGPDHDARRGHSPDPTGGPEDFQASPGEPETSEPEAVRPSGTQPEAADDDSVASAGPEPAASSVPEGV